MNRVTALVGVLSGKQKFMGQCLLNGRALAFDLWFPHLGVAIDWDGRRTTPEEIDTKRAWCHAGDRFIIYFAPVDLDEDGVRALGDLMRERLALSTTQEELPDEHQS